MPLKTKVVCVSLLPLVLVARSSPTYEKGKTKVIALGSLAMNSK